MKIDEFKEVMKRYKYRCYASIISIPIWFLGTNMSGKANATVVIILICVAVIFADGYTRMDITIRKKKAIKKMEDHL